MMNEIKICCSRRAAFQTKDSEENDWFSVAEIKEYITGDGNDLFEKVKAGEYGVDTKEIVSNLKRYCYGNILQGSGKTLNEARDTWNHLYFLDYDIAEWTSGIDGMKECLAELSRAFPNYLIIKPSNRFGIHVVLSSTVESYSGPEHVFYAFVAYRIIKKYRPVFKEENLKDQIMDSHFFNQFNQRMNMNYLCFWNDEVHKTAEFAFFNDSPEEYPRKVRSLADFKDDLIPEEQIAAEFYCCRGIKSRRDEVAVSVTKRSYSIDSSGKLSIDKSFRIPGVSYSGNDLRWRIVASIFEQLHHDVNQSSEIIKARFAQQDEMLAALFTIASSMGRGIYEYSNYLVDQFVNRVVLRKEEVDLVHVLKDNEYLSSYIDVIDQGLAEGSVYLDSSPNTGKTELAKLLFERKERCIIILHQKSILNSKYGDKYGGYHLSTIDAKKIKVLPNKIVCIWDTFAQIAKRFNIRNYTIIIDEVHNFVTAMSFRPVVFDVLRELSCPHQLWMTGTPLGEEALMPPHLKIRFLKRSKTKYFYRPLFVNAKNFYGFKEKIVAIVNSTIQQYDSMNDGHKRGVFIYDNHNHRDWEKSFDSCANYVALYCDHEDVREINTTGRSSKKIVSSTSYLGEGTDILGYKDVTVILPTNHFVSELNIQQFIKRFRDAETVTIFLAQFTDKVDIRMAYSQSIKDGLHQYLQGVALYGAPRNEACDEMLKIKELPTRMLRDFISVPKIKDLYRCFVNYVNTPFCIFMAGYLKNSVDDVIVDNIHVLDVEECCSYPSQMDEQLIAITNEHYSLIAAQLMNTDCYDDIIYWFEESFCDGEPCTFRYELRSIIKIIREANDYACLDDCASYYRNSDGIIQWRKIHTFIQNIKMFEAVSNKTKTLDSSIMSIHNNGLNREKGIQSSLDKYW